MVITDAVEGRKLYGVQYMLDIGNTMVAPFLYPRPPKP